ncbi:MAG TPA: hypothetical protein VGR76_16605 [Candidatus Angelobacter sp.]|nr:hypothetical protein [Candidatus Angelobacter sp.]
MQFAFWGIVPVLPLLFMAAGYEWRYLQSLKGQILIASMLVLPAVAMRWWSVREAKGVEMMRFEEAEESENRVTGAAGGFGGAADVIWARGGVELRF